MNAPVSLTEEDRLAIHALIDLYGHLLDDRAFDRAVEIFTAEARREPSQMLLWDNWRMVHCVTGAAPDEVRIMQRTTIMGDYGLGRKFRMEEAA